MYNKRKITHTLWTTIEKSILRGMLLNRDMTLDEIAKRMNRTKASVQHQSTRMGLEPTAHIKYSDEFKKVVYEFYEQTNRKETMEKFQISEGTLEGFVTRLRKNKVPEQKKNEWSKDDILFLMKYIGLQPKSFISMKLDRTESSINSFLKRRGFRLHYVNGLKKDEIDKHFRPTKAIPFLRTREGELILPWTVAEQHLEAIEIDMIQKTIIISMACFQRFLHGAKSNNEMSEKLFDIVTE